MRQDSVQERLQRIRSELAEIYQLLHE